MTWYYHSKLKDTSIHTIYHKMKKTKLKNKKNNEPKQDRENFKKIEEKI